MSKEKIPMKIVVPIIVVTWVLSLISSLAIVYMMPGLFPVKSEQIGTGLITSDMIADEAIITLKLANGNVTSGKIRDGTITAVDLADNSIITVKVANDSVTTAKIADGNVTTPKIADNAIIELKLAGDSVTTAKIVDGTITYADLANNSVRSAEIKDGEVKTIDIADYAVTDIKLAAGAIPHNVSNALAGQTISSTSFVDVTGMSVGLTLTRNSTLIIMFSSHILWSGPGPVYGLFLQALVNGTVTRTVLKTSMAVAFDIPSYTFYHSPPAVPGFYTIKIQGATASAANPVLLGDRTLTVIALPA